MRKMPGPTSPYTKIQGDSDDIYDEHADTPDHTLLNEGNGIRLTESDTRNEVENGYNFSQSPPETAANYYNPETLPLSPSDSLPRSHKSDTQNKIMSDHSINSYDSEEDEEDLGRYSVIFNHTLGNSGLSPHQYQGPVGYNDRGDSSRRCQPGRRILSSIHDARMESRRKRLERLLALPDDPTIRYQIERCGLCVSAWCDILDKGLFPILLVFIVYVVLLNVLENTFAKKMMLGIGIPLFVFRIGWRPLYCLISERRQERVS